MRTLSEQKYFNFAKFFILGLVFIFFLSPGKGRHWPFIYWELFDTGNPQIPQTATRIELKVLDTNQNWHSIPVKDLYAIDDDISDQIGSILMVQKIFAQNQSQDKKNTYYSYLFKHLEQKLNVEIKQIEAYKLIWEIDYDTYPPLDINKPNKSIKIDSVYSEQLR